MTPLQGLGFCGAISGIVLASAGAGLLSYNELGASTFEQLTKTVTETIFEPEVQDPEMQDPEVQDPEIQDPEPNDPEVQEPEVQDPEIDQDDPEVQDPEVQDPEIDDPDPGGPACPLGFSLERFELNAPRGHVTGLICIQQ